MAVKIPLTNDPNQQFEVTLPVDAGNISLGFSVSWNRIASYWQADIRNLDTDTDLIVGLPLLYSNGAYANLLYQFQYFGIGQLFVLPTNNTAVGNPQIGDWDVNFALVWSP